MMAKTSPNSDALELLPECERLVCFDETPANLIGGFNTLVTDTHQRLYLTNLHGDTLVLRGGNMPLAEADTSVLTSTTPKNAMGWFSKALRMAQDRQESVDTTALDTLAAIVAAAM